MLTGTAAAERLDWKFYRAASEAELEAARVPTEGAAVVLDTEKFLEQRREAVDFARIILGRTAARPAQFGCFGLHEWAMVYKQEANAVRHEYLELRLGSGGAATACNCKPVEASISNFVKVESTHGCTI